MFKDPAVLSGAGLAKTAPAFGSAIGRAFGMQMIAHSPEQAKAIYEAYKSGDVAGATEGLLNLGATAILGPKLIKGEGSNAEQFARYLEKTVKEEKLPESLAVANPMRELGVRVSGEPFLQPGVREAADVALREGANPIVVPGRQPALETLRSMVEPPRMIEGEPIRTAERIEGGGEAPYGRVSFMREAEAPSAPRTQEALRPTPEPVAEAAPVPETPSIISQIEEVSAMNAPTFRENILKREGGLTGDAYRVGLAVKTPEELASLQSNQAKAKADMQAAMKAGDLDAAMTIATKGQYFREAYEAATGTGSAGRSLRQTDPNYQPPMPEVTAAAPTPETAPKLTIEQKLEGLKFKTENGSRLYSLEHPDALIAIGKQAWNDTVDLALAGIKAGKSAKEAIDAALTRLRYNAKNYDEAKIRTNLESVLRDETNRPKTETISAKPDTTLAQTETNRPKAANLDDVYRIFEPAPKKSTPVAQRGVDVIEAVRTGVSSKFRPVNRLAQDIAKAYGRTESKDIAGIMEQLKGSQGKGEAQIYRFDKDVSDLVKGSEKDFNAYMFLRRSADRLARDAANPAEARRKVGNFTQGDVQRNLAALEQKLGPEKKQQFEQAADQYQRYMDDALQLQVESGRMSQEVYDAIKAGNQFYAPFKVMKYLEETSRPEGTTRKIDTVADFTKAMKGIEDADFKLGDMLGAARQSILISRILADKNMAMRNVAELAPIDTEGRFIRKFSEGQELPQGWETVNVMENGKVQKYATNPDVAQAVQIFGPAGNDFVSRVLGATGAAFRAGATSQNIPFQLSNFMADTPRSALISKYGIRGVTDLVVYPLEFVQSAFSSMRGNVFGSPDKLFLDYLDSGAAGSSVQAYLTPNALKFQEPTAIKKSAKLGKTVLSTIARFADAIEQSNKILGIKRAMRFEGVKSGEELARQIPEAVTEVRRFSGSPDFGRMGKWVEAARLNLIFMFLNARIQGTVADLGRITGRDGSGAAAKTWFKLAAAVGTPTLALYFFNQRPEYKEDYDKRSQQEKDNYWLIPKDSFITTEDGEKVRDYWRIPKRESSKWVANMLESAMEFAQKKDPESVLNFGNTMVQELSPLNVSGDTIPEKLESVASSLNPLFKLPLEAGTGRDLYRHRPLIPESMKDASPENQYTERTAEVFKKLAVAMPDVAPEILRSPIMLENMQKNLLGSMISQFAPRKPVQGRSDLENNPLLARFQAIPFTDNRAFKEELQNLERAAADDYLARHRQAVKLIDDNKGKTLKEIAAQAKGDPRLLQHLADLWIAKQNGITSQERQILALPARQRADYVTAKLKDMTAEQKKIAIRDLARKRILTEAVLQEMGESIK